MALHRTLDLNSKLWTAAIREQFQMNNKLSNNSN